MKKIIVVLAVLIFISCKKTTEDAPKLSNEKVITSFVITKAKNPSLNTDLQGDIKGSIITITIPANITDRDFIADFTVSPQAKLTVANVSQISGVSKNNFTNPVVYTVVAEDGSTAAYSVQLSKFGNSPSSNINQTTSYFIYAQKENFFYTNLGTIFQTQHGGYFVDEFAARSFYDFDKDGDLDLIGGTFNFDANVGFPLHYYKNNGGSYQRDQTVFEGFTPTYVHSRQSILSDFDKNGFMDVVVIGHGYDKDPFPGEKSYVLMNNNGKFTPKELPLPSGTRLPFTHSVCSGDIDNDGDVDIFMTSTMVQPGGIFLLNDGAGNFTYDASVFPNDITGKTYFTSVLYDLNADGYLDLAISGHDNDANVKLYPNISAKPMILWGNPSGKFTSTNSTILPVVPNYGVSNNFNILDYDKDGKIDLLITKTGDGASTLPFYQGYYIQLLKNNGGTNFSDMSSAVIGNYRDDNPRWIIWLRPHDIDNDGDLDIISEDKFDIHVWTNNGGLFAKTQ
ncbi:FG-GAP-like repeat-containing protein [Pedobacter sp. Du54]|uniref:FG-GAP-like repeat-containing protein n=1 Tax=Pedobacter anseongensis TaxID=3133439 RepID=UPI00309D80D6